MPKNLSLHTHNAFAPFPREFLGNYDVVNLRFLITILDIRNFDTLLKNVTALLSKYQEDPVAVLTRGPRIPFLAS